MVDSMSTDSAKPEFINLNVHKAGLDGLDQQRINQIIQEASKGSNFYTFQQRRQKRINEQIEQLKKRANSITDVQRQQAMKKADMIIADLEQRRVLNKIIVHFDMDMFFAAVEIKKDPSLADVPMAVGSLSMISTSNYIARRFGVRSAMAGFIAKKLCPQLKLIKPNFKNYAAESEFVMNIIRQYDPNLRTFSLDEVFIDLTDFVFDGYSKKNNVPLEDLYCMDVLSDDIWQFTNEVVTEIRAKVHEESRLTVSAGIACNTLLAKVCTDINKPNGQFMVKGQREEIMDFVSQIQIRKFTGIGPVRDQILSAFNIVKPTDLFNERVLLSCLFGDIDYYLRVYLGIGSTHLSNNESVQQKSHSRERTVGEMSNFDDICHLLKDISHRLSNDLKNEQQRCKTITLKLKKINFEMFIKCKTIDHYTDDEQIVFRVGKELLSQEMQKSPQNKYRLIGLKVSNLCNISNANDKVVLPSDQLTLSKFFQTSTKRKAIESEPDSTHSIDQIDDSSDSNFNENGELECNLCERTFTRITKFRYHRQFCRGNTGDSIYGLSSDSDDDDDCDGDGDDDYSYSNSDNNKDNDDESFVENDDNPYINNGELSSDTIGNKQDGNEAQFLKCPVCQSNTLFNTNEDLNRHIDICLNREVCIELTAIADKQKSDDSSSNMNIDSLVSPMKNIDSSASSHLSLLCKSNKKKSNKKKRLTSTTGTDRTSSSSSSIIQSANQTKIDHYYEWRK